MNVKDLRKKRWYRTDMNELCVYLRSYTVDGHLMYVFGVSSPVCSGNGGYYDRNGIYFEEFEQPAGSSFIRGLTETLPIDLPPTFLARCGEDRWVFYPDGSKRRYF